jgi:hypothetical protein
LEQYPQMSTEYAKIISLCVLSNYLSFDKNTGIDNYSSLYWFRNCRYAE